MYIIQMISMKLVDIKNTLKHAESCRDNCHTMNVILSEIPQILSTFFIWFYLFMMYLYDINVENKNKQEIQKEIVSHCFERKSRKWR